MWGYHGYLITNFHSKTAYILTVIQTHLELVMRRLLYRVDLVLLKLDSK